MSEDGPYTTLTVAEYNKMASVITQLRGVKQKARELLELGKVEEAKDLLSRTEEEQKIEKEK